MKKHKEKKVSEWLQNAVERVRDFAYTEPQKPPPERPRIGVALGGGFARGIAHLGVLRMLEQENIPVDFLGGTSAGAMLAIAYASGHSIHEIIEQAKATRFKDFGNWKLSWLGLASNQRLEHYPRKYLGVSTFEELQIPLVIAATDLGTGEPAYFTRGALGPALRASCAYPGMFVPVEHDGRTLVDGFLAAPVPVDAVRAMGADIVIAVFLEAASNRKPSSIVDVIGLSFAILQRHADLEWRRAADIIIEPNVKEFLWDDFDKTPELIAAGETAARAALPKILAALDLPQEQAPSVTAGGKKTERGK
ncbi:MAG TPA: patatin-like phospholipase family protein [Candidatus Dormibacteraeota bacterium]|nr:patatin-like phospholipase family protein [Candidatus Dormibacteraeota bacterium]